MSTIADTEHKKPNLKIQFIMNGNKKPPKKNPMDLKTQMMKKNLFLAIESLRTPQRLLYFFKQQN